MSAGPLSCEPGPFNELVGRRVLAVLDFDDEAARVVGRLVSTNWYGEFVVETDTGRRYCWPLLHAELAPAPAESVGG